MGKKLFSIVIPIYKNEKNLPNTIPYIMEHIPTIFPKYSVELILVNDGSPDNSWELMREYQLQFPEIIRIARFTKNFGQDKAVHYGISMAKGDVIGVISADLQDPFELFSEMLDRWEKGADLVCGIRADREEKGIGIVCSKIAQRLFHRFIDPQYPEGGFDFFIVDRVLGKRFVQIEEKNGSFLLLILWLSSDPSFIPYTRKKREIGTSGWTFSKKVKFFVDSFVTNSYLPIRIMSVTGALFSLFAFVYTIVIFALAIFTERAPLGWPSLAVLITFFSGLILAALGIIGEYLWRIYDSVKKRPMYLVKECIGFDSNLYLDTIKEKEYEIHQ